MAGYEQATWSEWSSRIIEQYGLKRTGKEFHGPCPNCGGTDRFWIENYNGYVKHHCRQNCDFKTRDEIIRGDGCAPSLPTPNDNVIHASFKDFPVYDTDTPYHTRKMIDLIGARLEGANVVVPLYDLSLSEVGHQTIKPDGTKRNSTGLDKSGGVFGLCGVLPEEGEVIVAEGWATTASVAMATGMPAVFAIDCHNLPLVCQKLLESRPRLQIIVAADNDDAGIEAATKTGLRWAAPTQAGWDWNDVWVQSGQGPILRGIKGAKRPGALFQKLHLIKPRSPEWIIEDTFEADTQAIVFGGSGEGKTFVVLDAALCISTGHPYHGRAVQKGPVAYISGEGNAGFSRRTAAWMIHNGFDAEDALFFKSMKGVTLAEDTIEDVIRELTFIRDAEGDLKLIVFDTLDRSIAGVEDSNDDVKVYLDLCDIIRNEFACTVLIVAHVGHGAQHRAKGSTKLRDRMDASYHVKAVGDHCIELKPTKMKDAPEPEAMLFTKISINVTTEEGEVVTSLALEQTDSRPASREMTHQEKMDVVIQQFNLHADFGNIPRSELKQHVCDELNIAQRTANKLIKDVVDLKILKVDGRSIVEGANYGEN
jgi:hypothetical protein